MTTTCWLQTPLPNLSRGMRELSPACDNTSVTDVPEHRAGRGSVTPARESDAAAQFARRWRRVGPLLAEIRRRELRDLTDEEALAAADALLGLLPQVPEKRDGTGLVEQQRLFALLRSG